MYGTVYFDERRARVVVIYGLVYLRRAEFSEYSDALAFCRANGITAMTRMGGVIK